MITKVWKAHSLHGEGYGRQKDGVGGANIETYHSRCVDMKAGSHCTMTSQNCHPRKPVTAGERLLGSVKAESRAEAHQRSMSCEELLAGARVPAVGLNGSKACCGPFYDNSRSNIELQFQQV